MEGDIGHSKHGTDATIANNTTVIEIKRPFSLHISNRHDEIDSSMDIVIADEDSDWYRVIVKPQGLPTMGTRGLTVMTSPLMMLPNAIALKLPYKKHIHAIAWTKRLEVSWYAVSPRLQRELSCDASMTSLCTSAIGLLSEGGWNLAWVSLTLR